VTTLAFAYTFSTDLWIGEVVYYLHRLTSSCPEYVVFGVRTIEGRTPESKTVGFWEVFVENRRSKSAWTALLGQKLVKTAE